MRDVFYNKYSIRIPDKLVLINKVNIGNLSPTLFLPLHAGKERERERERERDRERVSEDCITRRSSFFRSLPSSLSLDQCFSTGVPAIFLGVLRNHVKKACKNSFIFFLFFPVCCQFFFKIYVPQAQNG